MEVKELGHLVLYVRNLDRSASFYRDVLGWRQIMGGPGDAPSPFRAAAFSSPSGRTHHELLLIEVGEDAASLPSGRRVGLYHFGLKVGDSDDELREISANLKAAAKACELSRTAARSADDSLVAAAFFSAGLVSTFGFGSAGFGSLEVTGFSASSKPPTARRATAKLLKGALQWKGDRAALRRLQRVVR